jgi:Tat protein secretion system quality control protein TatD with DNase activity
MTLLPFDSHNHVHMGPSPPMQALLASSATLDKPGTPSIGIPLCGMAIMSTHPRDYERVLDLATTLPKEVPGTRIVPCLGVHPWFLNELTKDDWEIQSAVSLLPRWIIELEHELVNNPQAIVGEIGLDGFHFDYETKELKSPMETQIEAFRLQLELASRLERPVSIHSVRSYGPLMDTLSIVKKGTTNTRNSNLPPKLYFHAFGGKAATVDQLTALCGRETGKVYFGFAPVVNFKSPKTADLIRKVGLDRLVIESDHEDAALVPESIKEGVRFIAQALEQDESVVIDQTTRNAYDLYSIIASS